MTARPASLLALGLVVAGAAAPPNVDVSSAPGPQSEVSIAVDPTDPRVLVAGSNSASEPTTRTYSSTDGGATWDSAPGPPRPAEATVPGAVDPSVAIGLDGRQSFAFLATTGRGNALSGSVFVSTRARSSDAWSAPVRVASQADKPTLVVDASPGSPHRNRLYVAWTRYTQGPGPMLVSGSDDGVHWSPPVRASGRRSGVFASLSVGADGGVYSAWDTRGRIFAARSIDGGSTFGAAVRVATTPAVPPGSVCEFSSGHVPAQPLRCLTPNALVSAGGSRVFVTYASFVSGRGQDVLVTAFDRRLRRVLKPRTITARPEHPAADQFLPVSAVDPSTGRVWVCFYDTAADPGRVRATFSCSSSRDGGATWSRPAPVASVPSNEARRSAAEDGYGDYEGLAAGAGVAHPAWTDSRRPRLDEEIYTATLRGR